MIFQEHVSKNLSDEEFIFNYMNLIFLKPKDQLNPTSINTYNGRLNQ